MGNGQPGAGVDMSGFDFDFGQFGNFDEFINELLGRVGGVGSGPAGQTYSYRTSTGGPTGFGDLAGLPTSLTLVGPQLGEPMPKLRLPSPLKKPSRACKSG